MDDDKPEQAAEAAPPETEHPRSALVDGRRIPPPPPPPRPKPSPTSGETERTRRQRRRKPQGAPERFEPAAAGIEQESTAAEPAPGPPQAPTEEQKQKRKERVALVKDALKRSADVRGAHVATARAQLKEYLRRLNEPDQPSDEKFAIMLEAPFRAPPKPRGGLGGGRR